MTIAWGMFSGILGHMNRIFSLIIQSMESRLIPLEILNGFYEKIGDNYEKLLYKKIMGLFWSAKFVKRKWLLFHVDGPGSIRSETVFQPD